MIIATEIPIHKTTHIKAGIPVAAAIFAASVGCDPVAEIKNRSLRLKKAFSRHWTAKKATAKFTHFAEPNFAIAKSPAASIAPDTTVKKLPRMSHSPENSKKVL